jgi:hypothetical protein
LYHHPVRLYLRIAIGTALLIAGVSLALTPVYSTNGVFYGLILLGIYNIGSGIYWIGVENAEVRGYEVRQQRRNG